MEPSGSDSPGPMAGVSRSPAVNPSGSDTPPSTEAGGDGEIAEHVREDGERACWLFMEACETVWALHSAPQDVLPERMRC